MFVITISSYLKSQQFARYSAPTFRYLPSLYNCFKAPRIKKQMQFECHYAHSAQFGAISKTLLQSAVHPNSPISPMLPDSPLASALGRHHTITMKQELVLSPHYRDGISKTNSPVTSFKPTGSFESVRRFLVCVCQVNLRVLVIWFNFRILLLFEYGFVTRLCTKLA